MVELFDDLLFVWEGFIELHRTRKMGFSAAEPLGVPDILMWLDLHEVKGEERREMFKLISELDAEWLNWSQKKTNEEREKKKKYGKRDSKTRSRNRRQ